MTDQELLVILGMLLISVPIIAFARAYAVFRMTGEWPHQSERAMKLFKDRHD